MSNVAAGSNNFTDNTPEQVSQTRIIESEDAILNHRAGYQAVETQ